MTQPYQNGRTVWKFAIPIQDSFTVEMPAGATILDVGVAPDGPCFWALVLPAGGSERRTFALRGTGHQVRGELRYVGSFVHGAFVGHLFERRP